jgi:electron transport complex protein RnfD
MREFLFLLLGTALVNNVVLVKFLGLCPFMGVSNKLDTALSMGLATTFVLTLAAVASWLIEHYVLVPLGIEFLRILSFILIIAAVVQFTEMMIKKISPALYQLLGIFLPLIITLITALAGEALCLRIAGKPVVASLADGSATLTGWLLAMSLPPWAPWWIGVFGSLFAIIIGKHIFGGLGQNVFNPAMLARVALLISAPVQLTHWVAPVPLFSASAPGFLEGLAHTFSATIPTADGISSATLLGEIKIGLGQGEWVPQILTGGYHPLKAALGSESGSLGETSAVLLLAGGIWLALRRVISWHIPVAMLGTIALMASVFYMIDPQRHPDPGLYLMSGGLMLGAFFIATDFVTSPSTDLGQLIFGAG